MLDAVEAVYSFKFREQRTRVLMLDFPFEASCPLLQQRRETEATAGNNWMRQSRWRAPQDWPAWCSSILI